MHVLPPRKRPSILGLGRNKRHSPTRFTFSLPKKKHSRLSTLHRRYPHIILALNYSSGLWLGTASALVIIRFFFLLAFVLLKDLRSHTMATILYLGRFVWDLGEGREKLSAALLEGWGNNYYYYFATRVTKNGTL